MSDDPAIVALETALDGLLNSNAEVVERVLRVEYETYMRGAEALSSRSYLGTGSGYSGRHQRLGFEEFLTKLVRPR